MQTIAVQRAPSLPNTDVLANGSVSAAGHVAEDAVKEERRQPRFAPGRVRRVFARKEERREDRCVYVGHHKCWTREPRGLVDEQLRSFGVAIVRHQ